MSVSRRTLLAGASAGLLFSKTAPRLGCQTNSWPIDPKKLSSFAAVLERIKAFDFQGFETGFKNVQEHFGDPAEVRAVVAKSGLRFLGVHIFLLKYDPRTHIAPAELYRRVADGAALIGAERLILSGAPAAADGAPDRAAIHRKCGALNEAAAYASSKGLRFAYHNHGPEFSNGGAEIEALYAGTDPKLVEFVFDTGHARRAKANVPEFLSRHYKRIAAMHLRDLSDRPGENTEVGPFDLHALALAIAKTGWHGWLIVEEENAVGKSGDDAVRPARDALRAEFGV